jgi:hypothetical protein
MKIQQYPQMIASLEETLLQVSLDVEIYAEHLSFFDGEIETQIAVDGDLKNEQMRKAKRLQLQQDQDYLDVKNRLKEAKVKRERFAIQLNQARNEFAVAKLEARQAIANSEAVAVV